MLLEGCFKRFVFIQTFCPLSPGVGLFERVAAPPNNTKNAKEIK